MDYLHSKALKSLKFLRKNKSSFGLILLGLFIFTFGAVNYYRVRILSFNSIPKSVPSTSSAMPVSIKVPSLKIDLPIDQAEIKNGVWEISYKNATYLNTSAKPGDNGNIVIYGHNKTAIFGNIPYLKVGEVITITTNDGKVYNYKLVEKIWATPDQIELLAPTDSEVLTIYTCWGLFDSQRVVLKALPLK